MNTKPLYDKYLKRIHEIDSQGDAREESFYPALAELIGEEAHAGGRNEIRVTTLPKSTEAGNPDFRVWDGENHIIGYVEAKKPSVERLDEIESSEQLKRYLSTFPNLILTNFLEFRLYRNGQRVETVPLANPFTLNTLRVAPPADKPDELHALLERFLDFSLPRAFTAESLAVELAKRTRFLRDVIEQQLEQEKEAPGELFGFFEAFQKFLIGTLKQKDFADLFAQTISYGLFAARTRAGELGEDFSRRAAFDNIPHTIGVLRDLFRFISFGDLNDELAWCVEDIAEVLAVADASGILARYYREGKGGDPIVHFYETFLAQYDPTERERRGVYYTPEPVVSYIVRSLHHLLKTEFGKQDGLASDGVTLLDPAAGTMTFVARAAQEAVHEFEGKYGSGARENFIRGHILRNFYAFELMMAPYAVGHLKMGFFLEELGHKLTDNERMPFYLTNALDIEELEQRRFPGLSSLAEESRLAREVKRDKPILVILGNPPYSGESTNRGEWIRELIEDYKTVDGKSLGEKNPKWLQDDYVKFLRFAQWKIERAGCGVAGMITNHAYLDNPTFRGMRRSLMGTYDEIYILDLHGNSLKRETCPDGSPDQNVFDIRQGVAIAFFIKHGGERTGNAIVRHANLWGLREEKYEWLNQNDLELTPWRDLNPAPPFYLFIPRDNEFEADYLKHPSVSEIFPVNSVGVVTARDSLTIHWTPDEAWKTVTVFSRMDPELARQAYKLGKDVQDWKVESAQEDLRDSGPMRDKVTPILYRPFDVRHTYYTGRSRGFICRPRIEVMRHMLAGENLALVTHKREELDVPWSHALVTNFITEHGVISSKTTNYHFPLYLYPETKKPRRKGPETLAGVAGALMLFEPKGTYAARVPNLSRIIVESIRKAHGREATPEEIFHYVYAVLYAPAYRERYAQFLKSDFPRIPFTANAELFQEMAGLGERLVSLHLLKSPELGEPSCKFEGDGDCRIARGSKDGLRYDSENQSIRINKSQYFAPVPKDVWEYRVGGYQVCEKWLKERLDRRLELEDIRTYLSIVTALNRTLEIQKTLDTLYERAESDTIGF
jgi:predicted helicase